MTTPIAPYLALMQRQLATTLMPKDDDNAQRIARYSHQVLTQLLLQSKTLPELHAKAIAELGEILGELNAHLPTIVGAMVLTGELTHYIRVAPDFAKLEPVLQRTVSVLIANPSQTSTKLLKRISDILENLQEAIHQAALKQKPVAEDAGASKPPLSDEQKAALQAWLRRKFPAEAAVEIGNIKFIVGGGSKMTLIVGLKNTKELPATVILRADAAGGVVQSTVADEYQLIDTVYKAGVIVPKPIAEEKDTSVIGAPFVIVSCMPGRNIGDHVDVYEPSESFALGVARALGKLHAIPPEKFSDTTPGAKDSVRERLLKDIGSFEATWRNSGHPSVSLELAYAWLRQNIHLAEGRRALNHGDVGCHNMLADKGELTALLDWETIFIGNPAYDVAYFMPEAEQCVSRDNFLAEYVKAGGTMPTQGEMDYYSLLVAVFKIGYLFVARSFFHSGISDSLILAFGTQHLYQRCEHNLQKVINDIYKRM